MDRNDAIIEYINRYANYLREMKQRISVIQSTVKQLRNGQTITGYRETDIELCFLQFRATLELMMYAALVAHESQGKILAKKLHNNEYNATKLLRHVRRINPRFYPAPKTDWRRDDGVWVVEDVTEGYLSEADFGKLYDRLCGPMLHARRTSKFLGRHDDIVDQISSYLAKLMKLLNQHWIVVSDDIVFRALMQDKATGDVGVNLLELQSDL